MNSCLDGDGGIEGCGATWTGAAKVHCATCHRTFGSQGTADKAHRYPASGIKCLDPAHKGLRRDEAGVWRRAAPPQAGAK